MLLSTVVPIDLSAILPAFCNYPMRCRAVSSRIRRFTSNNCAQPFRTAVGRGRARNSRKLGLTGRVGRRDPGSFGDIDPGTPVGLQGRQLGAILKAEMAGKQFRRTQIYRHCNVVGPDQRDVA